MIENELPNIKILTQEDKGYSSDAKEAIAFVILGNETMHQHFQMSQCNWCKTKSYFRKYYIS